MRNTAFIIFMMLFIPPSWGAIMPNGSRYDSHIQQVSYNAQNSTVVNTRVGYVTTLLFADDEVVNQVEAGFEKGWQITKDGNSVSIRPAPIAQPVTDESGTSTQQVFLPVNKDWKTNLFVRTSKHVYSMDLVIIDDGQKADNQAYVITWRYPAERLHADRQELEARQEAARKAQEQANISKAFNSATAPRNWSYTKRVAQGSDNIAPDFAYDDGRFTYIGFSPLKQMPAPTLIVNGNEQTVVPSFRKMGNYRVMIVNVSHRIVLRYGNAVVGIENTAFGKSTVSNGSTVSPDVKLDIKP